MPVLELRVALTAADFDWLFAFYRDGLGLDPDELWVNEKDRGALFQMGRGTLEVLDEPHAAIVDQLEAEQRISGPIRLALQVPDVDAALKSVLEHGAKQIHEPVMTPWGHRNVRIQSPDGLQITLFQVLKPE